MSRSRFFSFHQHVAVATAALMPLALGCSEGANRTASKADSARPVTAAPTVAATTLDTTSAAGTIPVEVSYGAAQRSFRGGRYAEAAELFSSLADRNPRDIHGQYMLGVSSWKAGDRATAESAFDRVLAIDSTHQRALLNSSRVLLETARPADAKPRIERALSLKPATGETLRLLGRVRSELGETDGAIDAYHQALALDGQDVWAMNNLGHLLIQAGRFQDALAPLARAVALRPGVAMFQNNLGTVLERGGYYAEAAAAFGAAVAADSSYRKAAVGLERVGGRTDDPAFGTLDLSALAEQFEVQRQAWGEATDAAPVNADSTVSTSVNS